MLFRTIQFFSLWDLFPTRGNEKNSRMDCYLCLDHGQMEILLIRPFQL